MVCLNQQVIAELRRFRGDKTQATAALFAKALKFWFPATLRCAGNKVTECRHVRWQHTPQVLWHVPMCVTQGNDVAEPQEQKENKKNKGKEL